MIVFYQPVYPVLDYRERAEAQRETTHRALHGSGCSYSIVPSQCGSENEMLRRRCWDAEKDGARYYAYLHSKGTTHPGNPSVDDWRELLEYCTIDCWDKMLECLAHTADVLGVNLEPEPFLHFAGNFFGIRADAAKTLKAIAPGDNPKAWIGTASPPLSLASVHHSRINHYVDRYPPARYH